jgi:Ni,Fe-hydrogenase III small subunit
MKITRFSRGSSAFRSLFRRPLSERAGERPPVVTGVTLRGSLQLRHVDVGSCNGCEVEITSALAPHYDAGQFGIRLVASPRHADGLLVTGVVTHNMDGPLRQTLAALPRPSVIVACGDCAVNGGIFAQSQGVNTTLDQIVTPDVSIPGCPPHPRDIVSALRSLSGR